MELEQQPSSEQPQALEARLKLVEQQRDEALRQLALLASQLDERDEAQVTQALLAVNEELTSQAEELTSQGEELASQAEELSTANQQLQTALEESLQARQTLERTQRAMLNMMEDLAETQQRLEESNRELRTLDLLKDEFISILSHELRTPVNAITGFGSVLADGVAGELTPQQQAYLEKMLGGADRLLALVNDLLDYSRIRAGKFVLEHHLLDARDILRESFELLRELAAQKGIAITCELPPYPLPVLGDHQRLGQVLVNLINNAIKFTAAGGSIVIRGQVRGEVIYIEVGDTGMGIAPQDIRRLFQRFGQLDTSNTRRAQGTGLGLAIVKSLVDAHGGDVGVMSEQGQGSTFWFTVPVADKELGDA